MKQPTALLLYVIQLLNYSYEFLDRFDDNNNNNCKYDERISQETESF